jgi:hypothetical protein
MFFDLMIRLPSLFLFLSFFLSIYLSLSLACSLVCARAFAGAGLSYAPLLPPHAGLLEIATSAYQVRPHFRFFAKWASIEYRRLNIPDANDENMQVNAGALLTELHGLVTLLRSRLPPLPNFLATRPPTTLSAVTGKAETAPLRIFIDPNRAPATLATTTTTTITTVTTAATSTTTASTGPSALGTAAPSTGPKPPAAALTKGPPQPVFASSYQIPPRPPRCTACDNHRLAIIVPYRDSANPTSQGADRAKNLAMFVPYMNEFLHRAGRDFTIFIIEQTQGHVFNKGALFNVGYQLVKKDYDYIVLHDIDQLPESKMNTYEWRDRPTHLCTASSQFGALESGGGLYGVLSGLCCVLPRSLPPPVSCFFFSTLYICSWMILQPVQ